MARKYYTDEELGRLAREAGFKPGVLAKKMGICQRQLQRRMQEEFGCCPQDRLDERRMDAAPAELLKTHLVKVAARELGYSQPSHFSRQFKRRYGLSPADFLIRAVNADTSGIKPGLAAKNPKMSATDMKCPPQIRQMDCEAGGSA